MPGMLYLCATPIGNLGDMTPRVIEALQAADLIAAEDTRNSIKLLNHFGIRTSMTSYHEYNKVEKADYLVGQMRQGKNVALISDAGTPAISDPGEELVRQAYEAGVNITSLPGACACITALTLSGMSTRRFAFEAFLPSDKKERKIILEALKTETRTIIIYEAPHHLKQTLDELYNSLGNRQVTICRELTKLHETIELFTLSAAIDYYNINSPKGEYVLVIKGTDLKELELKNQENWQQIDILSHMEIYLSKGISKKDAMKKVAADRGISKREVYQFLIEKDI